MLTFEQIQEIKINTTWQIRLAEEPLKNLIRRIKWNEKKGNK